MCTKVSSSDLLDSWIKLAPNVSVAPSNNTPEDVKMLHKIGLSSDSILGCVCRKYGYILCGNKHIRLMGGKTNSCFSMLEVNDMDKGYSVIKNILIVADTSEGGIFAINCSEKTGADIGEILFLPAKALTWERLNIGYADFAKWAITSSEESLVSGQWIERASQSFSMQKANILLRAKICILKSFGKTRGEQVD